MSVVLLCAAAAPAARADSVYVTNHFGGTVSQFDAGADGALGAKSPATVAAGTTPNAIVVSPDGRSAYVANNGSANVSQYDVGDDGALTPKSPPTVGAGTNPLAIAVTPDGKSVYATNGDGSISQYDLGAGGVLTPKVPAAVNNGAPGFGVAVSPDGESAYVASDTGFFDMVSQYDIGANGHLTPKSPAAVSTGPDAIGVAVSPDSASVYVAIDGNIAQYDAGAGGTLAPKSPATVAAGQGPYGIAVSRNGTSVYVTNQGANRDAGGNTVSQFDVASGGGLVAKSVPSVSVGETPRGVAMSTDGGSVYVPVLNSAHIAQFDVGSGGLLAAKSSPVVAAGSGPDGVAVSPFGSPPPTDPGRPGPGGERPPGNPGPTAPQLQLTRITSGPSGVTPSLPTFTFDSPLLGAAATFECRFDAAPFRACTSPRTGYDIISGTHTFEVRAIGTDGVPDATPASRTFTVAVQTRRGSCEIQIPWQLNGVQRCVALDSICPAGSLCTLTGTVDVTSEDEFDSWNGDVLLSYADARGANAKVAYCSSDNYHPPNSPSWTPCPITTSLTHFGADDRAKIECSIGGETLDTTRVRRGPDDVRRLSCTGTLKIQPAPSLIAKPFSGVSSGAFLPGAGTLTVTGTTTGTARVAASKKRRARTAFKTIRIRAAGPGAKTFKFKLTPAANKAFKRKRSLKVSLKLTFVAADRTRTVKTQRLTIRLPQPKPRPTRRP